MNALNDSFNHAMKQLLDDEQPDMLAVAVSGGADSMALALLSHDWAQSSHKTITALIVDHGLRDESAEEAKQVADWLTARGIQSQILTIDMSDVASAIQETARKKRYVAMTDYCHQHGIKHLLFGHHRGDQAETILFRWLRQSRFDGLAGMAAKREESDVMLLRPLLYQSKSDLQHYLKSQDQPWVEDPSNQNIDYSRVQMRQLIAAYSETETRLSNIAQGFARIRQREEMQLLDIVGHYVSQHECGVVELQHSALATSSPDMAGRLLLHLLMAVSGSSDLPRYSKIEALHEQMLQQDAATLHGCELKRHGDAWLVYPELSHLPPDQPIRQGIQQWGGFMFEWNGKTDGYSIGHLREEERVSLKGQCILTFPLTTRSALTLPTIRHLDLPVCIPHMGYESDEWQKNTLKFGPKPVKLLGNLPFFAMNDA